MFLHIDYLVTRPIASRKASFNVLISGTFTEETLQEKLCFRESGKGTLETKV